MGAVLPSSVICAWPWPNSMNIWMYLNVAQAQLSWTQLNSTRVCSLPCPAQLGYSSFIALCCSCGPKSNGQWIMDKAKRKILDKLIEKGEWERKSECVGSERKREGEGDSELTLTPCSSCAYFLISRSRSSWHQIKRDERDGERSENWEAASVVVVVLRYAQRAKVYHNTHTHAHTRILRQLIHLAGCHVGQTEWRHLNAHKSC